MMVVMSLYSVVDGAFVSWLIGTNAFSAVNIVYPMLGVSIGLGTMFGTGLAAIVAKKLGQGKNREACENLTFVVLVVAVIGVLASAIVLFFVDDIVRLLGANEQIFDYCRSYAYPLMFFIAPSILQLVFQVLLVADGKPTLGLWITVGGGVLNIALDYFFIAVCDWGIAGAAIGTGIGYLLPTLFGIGYFALHRSGSLHFVRPRINWGVFGHTASNGSSEMVSNLSTSVTTLLFNLIMMRLLGPDGVAAISILLYLDFVLIAVNLGYSMGAAPLISYNYGSGNHAHLCKIFKTSVCLSFAVGLLMSLITIVFARQLTAIFAPRGSNVYELAVVGLRIYALSYACKGYNVFASAMFTAFGNGRVSAGLSFLRTLVLLVTCLLGLSTLFGLSGVWAAAPVAELLALGTAVIATVKYREKYHYF